MRLDGKVVASTSNFLSGPGGFAFKIAWNPDLAKQSPGRLAEVELLRQMFQHQALAPLDFWDSGATEGSYIDNIWPGRRRLVSLGVACSPLARSIMAGVHVARVIRRRVRARQEAAAAAAAGAAEAHAPAAPPAPGEGAAKLAGAAGKPVTNGSVKLANGGAKPGNGAPKTTDGSAKPPRKAQGGPSGDPSDSPAQSTE
jgi:hypothetical protein